MKKLIIFILTPIFFSQIIAQAKQSTVPEINQKKEHVMKSTVNGNTYYLYVSLPAHYSPKDTTRYPVLFLLDGNTMFPIAHAARQMLDFFNGLEKVIVVGIGYTFEKSYQPYVIARWNDYTPSTDQKLDTNPATLKLLDLQTGALKSGGASVFIDVLKKEIIPFVDKNYKTNTDRGIAGHSYGGLLATYCMFTAPDMFRRYGINSASLWWNNNEMVSLEKSFYDSRKVLNAKVFISVGASEGPMVDVAKAFSDSLNIRNYKDLKVTTQVFENENHMSVIAASMSRTLRVLYPKKK